MLETLYGIITKEKVNTSEGIKCFGKVYEYEVFEKLEDKLPEFIGDFGSQLDSTLSVMMFSHYLLRPIMGGVDGDEVVQITLDKDMVYLEEFPMGVIPKGIPQVSTMPDGLPIAVDLNKVVIKELMPPTSMELPPKNVKNRILFVCYFQLEFLS
jgi:hypothetical protein